MVNNFDKLIFIAKYDKMRKKGLTWTQKMSVQLNLEQVTRKK